MRYITFTHQIGIVGASVGSEFKHICVHFCDIFGACIIFSDLQVLHFSHFLHYVSKSRWRSNAKLIDWLFMWWGQCWGAIFSNVLCMSAWILPLLYALSSCLFAVIKEWRKKYFMLFILLTLSLAVASRIVPLYKRRVLRHSLKVATQSTIVISPYFIYFRNLSLNITCMHIIDLNKSCFLGV